MADLFEVSLTPTEQVPDIEAGVPFVEESEVKVTEEVEGREVTMQVDTPRYMWDDIGHLQFHLDVNTREVVGVVREFQKLFEDLVLEFGIDEDEVPQSADEQPPTEKQVAFLRKLLGNQPDIVVPSTRAETSALIERLLEQQNSDGQAPAPAPNSGASVPSGGARATEKQIGYIRSLLQRLGQAEPAGLNGMSKSDASKYISQLLGQAR